MLIPNVMLGNVLMLASALLLNNIFRQFPMYWWTPESLSRNQLPDWVNDVSISEEMSTKNAAVSTPSTPKEPALVIRRALVVVPESLDLSMEEKLFLQEISNRI
jgi:hypothetical protein